MNGDALRAVGGRLLQDALADEQGGSEQAFTLLLSMWLVAQADVEMLREACAELQGELGAAQEGALAEGAAEPVVYGQMVLTPPVKRDDPWTMVWLDLAGGGSRKEEVIVWPLLAPRLLAGARPFKWTVEEQADLSTESAAYLVIRGAL